MTNIAPEMTKQEANARIAELVNEYHAVQKKNLAEAIALADKFGLAFDWDGTYGSQEQRYIGQGADKSEWEEFGWTSSSHDC